MSSANAARNLEEVIMDEAATAVNAPASEQARYEPRYRVVQRRTPAPAPKVRGLTPLQRTLVLAMVPTLCLLVYVLFWTLSMRGGFVRDRLQQEHQRLLLDQRDLQADVRRLQAPGDVLSKVHAESDLQPGVRREYAPISAAALKSSTAP